eukprot:Skav231167  [mRNA]  locus=scaffold3252:295373:295996:+ [translate_table: standard]
MIDHEASTQEQMCAQLVEDAGQGVFLQTKMYSIPNVMANIEECTPRMKSELASLIEETGAVRVITTEEAEKLRAKAEAKGILHEKIPAKAIFSRKAGSGKHKCRSCACGNYRSGRDLTDTYAGGTGATEERSILRKASLHQWDSLILNIKTAFLRAPRDHSREIVIVQPPNIFFSAGLCEPGTLWLVDRSTDVWTDHESKGMDPVQE